MLLARRPNQQPLTTAISTAWGDDGQGGVMRTSWGYFGNLFEPQVGLEEYHYLAEELEAALAPPTED